MKDWLSKIARRFRRDYRKSAHRYSSVAFVDSLPDVPIHVGNEIYIVGSSERAKWVVFDCPCLKGHKLTVNLMKSRYPHWSLKLSGGKVSLSPSIVVTDHPCKSHFWLKSNQIYMAFED